MTEYKYEDWSEEYEQDSANLLDLLDEIMAVEIKPEEFSIPDGAQLYVPAGQPLPQKVEDQTITNTNLPESYLQILQGNQQGRKIVVTGVVVIGRSENSADIALQDNLISRSHLRIEQVVGGFQIEDLGSSNGTKVNGQPIRSSVVVTPGDRITLGDTTLQVMGETIEDFHATRRQKFCTKCGQPLKPEKRFCTKCGAVID